jgi:hypothetical protein
MFWRQPYIRERTTGNKGRFRALRGFEDADVLRPDYVSRLNHVPKPSVACGDDDVVRRSDLRERAEERITRRRNRDTAGNAG